MALKVAKRGAIPPFIVMDVLREANRLQAKGENILHMEVGQPASAAPLAVRQAAQQALDSDKIGYTDALGIPELREAIAGHYRQRYQLSVDPSRIVATTGSSSGFILSFLAAFEPGDVVAMAAPGYPAYRNILTALGVEARLIETGEAERFQPTPELLSRAGKIDGLIVASPSNPTGTMLSGEALKALCDYCSAEDIRLVSDEIYHGITFDFETQSALRFSPDAIVINSFSKYFCMTGWRLGWMVLPEDLIRPVECLAQNLFISPPTLSQIAGCAAFACYDELNAIVAGYARNREILLTELPRAGFEKLAPADGAFYVYADVARLTNDSQSFCRHLLQDVGVAVTPGVDFDPDRGHQTLRFSFAGPEAEMIEACARLRNRSGH